MNKDFGLTNKPYFYCIPKAAFNDSMLQANKNCAIITIEGTSCNNRENLFKSFANKFNFPDYFGGNWMAFDECINDLDWLSLNGCVLIIRDANKLLCDQKEELKYLFHILNRTVSEWNEGRSYDEFPTRPIPFHIVLVTEENEIKDVINRVNNYGIEIALGTN